jgi:SAM-dependent methyltransferase
VVDEERLQRGYDGSCLTFQLLRACGWGTLLNLGFFRLSDWLLNPLRLDVAQERLAGRSIELLNVADGDRVLDVACGRGKTSYMVAMKHPGSSVTGIDILTSNVAIASDMWGNTRNLDYEVGDATRLEFADSSHERMLCLEAAFHFDREAFLRESRRILRPGGVLVNVDFMWKDPGCREALSSEDGDIVRDTWKFDDFSTVDEYLQMAASAGLRVAAGHDWSRPVCGALGTRLRLLSWASERRLFKRILCCGNVLLRHFSGEDWATFRRSARAHLRLGELLRYMCLVLVRK